VLQSTVSESVPLGASWINGWYDLPAATSGVAKLTAPAGSTTVTDLATGRVTTGATVTYVGLPIMGFAVQSFSNGQLPGLTGKVLSNYGGQIAHKFTRRIEVAQ